MSDDQFTSDVKDAAAWLLAGVEGTEVTARNMTDAELGEFLLNGRYTTIEVHEAGLRLARAAGEVRPAMKETK